MAKRKQGGPPADPPSRRQYKQTYLPKAHWESLRELGVAQERSVAYLVKKAVEEYLQKHGKLPPKPSAS